MGSLRQIALIVGVVLLLSVGSVEGQTVGGYRFSTGVDSTLWVDMTDAHLYTTDTSQGLQPLLGMGFEYYFCGAFYHRFTVDYRGVLYLDRRGRNIYPSQIFANGATPFFAPYLSSANIYANEVYWKVVGTSGNHTFVVEINMAFDESVFRTIQIQLSERDGGVLYLYGARGDVYSQSNFWIAFKGADGTIACISNGHNVSSEVRQWSAGFTDWPGESRYYRFVPDSLSCCGYPKNVEVLNVTDEQACISWGRSDRDIGYEFEYRTSSEAWTTISTIDTSVTLSDLLPSTSYEYQVRSICNDSCTSIKVNGVFRTICSEEAGNYIRFANINGDSVDCYIGYHSSPSIQRMVVDYGPESINSRHTVHTDTNERDSCSNNMLRTIPEGHCQSVRLGNWRPGGQEEAITYTIKVDSNRYDLLILRYAIVEENPNHELASQPKFLLSVRDSVGHLIDNCYYANFVSGAGDSAWQGGIGGVVWRDWAAVGIDLTPLHGRTILVNLDNYDCAPGGHFGYAYFTLESGFKHLRSAYCGNTNINTFYAPKGFSYRWYRADNPTQTLSRADSLTVTGVGAYVCRASYTTGDSSCGFTLTTYAGTRFPVAAFTAVPADSCGYSFKFENNSIVALDEARTQLTNESCEQYLWRFGDGTTSSAINPTHTFETGTYNVELVAMLANGQCRDSISQTITVNRLRDTIADTVCVGGVYSFYGAFFYTPGFYTVKDGCWQHSVRLAHHQYFYQEIDDTVCEDETYILGDNYYDTAGVYDIHLTTVEGCDSSYHLTLSFRPLPVIDYEIDQTCHGDTYYYLSGRYREAPPSLVEPGSVAFVGEDSLLYRWSVSPATATLPTLTEDGAVRIAPIRRATYYLQYQYQNNPACPVFDTFELVPLEEIAADLEVSPTWLGYDNMELTVLDRSRNASGRQWWVDGVEQDEEGPILYYTVSPEADSVVVGIVAYNATCVDSAECVVPVLRHLLMFPNVFTPSLATNNHFGPIGSNVTDYELWIYDRRGALVFHSTDMEETWDGTCNGIPLRQEAYAYTCRYTTPTHDRLSTTGTVTLLR